eukprot:g16396.t1
MTTPFRGAGRLRRSGTFYAQAAYNVLICAAVLFVHLFLFWLAFEHNVAAVWTDFALSRNAFLGLATLAPILGYMLWVDGVLVPLFVVVWALLAPVGFNFQGAENAALHPPIGFVLLMWPAKFLLGSSTVGAAFLFLSELSIALPFCLRYLFFGLPREVIACLGHGFLSLVSVALCGCCCGGRGARVRPYYSRLTGLEKRKTSSRGRDAWVRYRDVDRVVQLVTTILELLLIPMVIVPFALERLLFRYVDESGNHSHYIVMLHGMGANSANYLYARYFFGVHGLTTTVIYINWLSGPFLLSYSGNVEEITDDVVAQVRARLERIQAGRERLALGSKRSSSVRKVTSSVRNRLGSQTLEAPPMPPDEEDETRPVARKEELLFPAPLENVELYSIASMSGPFCGSDTVLWLYRTFPESLLKPLLGGGNALHIDLLPRSEQTADLSRTLARIVARGRAAGTKGSIKNINGKRTRKSTSTHLLRGGAHFFGGSGDFLVYPYSAFGLMFPTNDHGAVENFYPAAVTLESVAANTSFAVLTNLGHYNIAVSATLWRSILSRVVVREVQ